ncbi:MAG: hypothetical protein ACQJCO_01130 [cyanobacterium endosymbiont of Rhopalodia sterrenbergii]
MFQAIIELREALKTKPNNSVCHGSLGLASLKDEVTHHDQDSY